MGGVQHHAGFGFRHQIAQQGQSSVAEVQFTLLLTIALVVGVIFLFLRNLWATIIPAVSGSPPKADLLGSAAASP
jgi:hypothetical protein